MHGGGGEMSDLLNRVGARVSLAPWGLLALVACAVVLLKGAIWVDWDSIRSAGIPAAAALPRAIEYFSASFGLPAIARMLGASALEEWIALSALLAIACLAVSLVFTAIRYRGEPARRAAALLAVALLPLTTVTANAIGRSDFLILLAATLIAAGRTWRPWVIGAVLFVAANPEQAFVATLSLLVLSLCHPLEGLRKRAWLSLCVASFGLVLAQIWLLTSGVVSSRAAVNLMLLESSLVAQVSQWPWLLYSIAGALWIALVPMLAWAWSMSTPWRRVALLVGLLGMPLVATFLTLDGVRVLAAVSAPVLLAALLMWIDSSEWDSRESAHRMVGALAIGGVLAPPVVNAWSQIAPWILTPVINGISEALAPLRDWATNRFPNGNL